MWPKYNGWQKWNMFYNIFSWHGMLSAAMAISGLSVSITRSDIQLVQIQAWQAPEILLSIGKANYCSHRQNMYCSQWVRCHLVLSEVDRARFGLDLYHQPAIIGWGVCPAELPISIHCSSNQSNGFGPIFHPPSPNCTLAKNAFSLDPDQFSRWIRPH